MNFSIASMRRIFRKNSDKRISHESARKLGTITENTGLEISQKAMEYAEQDGRKTVREVDMKKAIRDFRR